MAALLVGPGGTVEVTNDTGNALPVTDSALPDLVGTWGYSAGTSGTVTLTGSKRVVGITAFCSTAGSMTINGGDSVPLPANLAVQITPLGNVTDPTIVFTGTASYFVEHLVG